MMKKHILLILISAILFSCETDQQEVQEKVINEIKSGDCKNKSTFGIRHDKKLSTYELIASNQAPFNTPEYPDFSPVVMFRYLESEDKEIIASGTLINSEWILTAAHNFIERDNGNITQVSEEEITVMTGTDPNTPTSVNTVSKIVVHPAYLTDNEDFGNYDMCLVKLSKPITTIEPAKLNFVTDNLLKSMVWISGYGIYKKEQGQDPDKLPKRHAIQNIIDKTADNEFTEGQETFKTLGLIVDFDDPCGKINTLGEKNVFTEQLQPVSSAAKSLDFEGVLVEGDSGGPMFAKSNDGWQLVGINAYEAKLTDNAKDSEYGAVVIHIGISPYESWIDSVISN